MSSKLWDLIKACHPRLVRLLVQPPEGKELYLECMEINVACLNGVSAQSAGAVMSINEHMGLWRTIPLMALSTIYLFFPFSSNQKKSWFAVMVVKRIQ